MPDRSTEEAWALVVQWRPLVYKLLAEWATRKAKRPIQMRGRIGQPHLELSPADEFEWLTGGALFGVDGRSFMQDFEVVALEATLVASRSFDESRGLAFETYLRPILWHDLEDAFKKWIKDSASMESARLELANDLEGPPLLKEPEDGLDPDVRDALQEALGSLTAKQAWALRMQADGVPVEVIQERLGHAQVQTTYNLLDRAKAKALEIMQENLPEADVQ